MMESFHLLRPWWLAAIVPAVGLWYLLRRADDPTRTYQSIIAPHLLTHLIVQPHQKHTLKPRTLLLALFIVLAIALSGPTWRQEPSPFAEEQAGLMILMRVSESMAAEDLKPSRMVRAHHKVHDLVSLRDGGTMGLIAYSGSAHMVMPLTKDGRIVDQMAQSLEPSIMPAEGDALSDALALAEAQFERAGAPGSILVITDSVAASQLEVLNTNRSSGGVPVQVLTVVGSDQAAAQSGFSAVNVPVQRVTVDDKDVQRVLARAESQVASSVGEREDIRWRDSGYALVPVILLLQLMWARKGFSVRWV